MTLILTLLRCPDDVPPETRQVSGGEFSIGRGPENDWVLPDAERHLSKRHCVLACRGGLWQLADISTNGTFLNREADPVGAGRIRDIRDGDRLRLGAYEIELRIEAQPAVPLPRAERAAANPFADDPFAPGSFGPGSFGPDRFPPSRPTPSLPPDFDRLAPPMPEAPFAGAVQPDHTPAVEDAFRPPRPAAAVLPDDWDLDLGEKPRPPAASFVSEAPLAPAGAPPPPAASDGELLAALLRGAGCADARSADPVAMMEALGRAFRAVVSGLREAMIARAAIKGEFRIEQTMIRARGNNPLKFSAGDDDALAALLGLGRHTDMDAAAAIADALSDMRLHELATISAMQTAVRALLAELDPAVLRRAAEQAGRALMPAQRKGRAWDAFETLHARITKALADDFDSVFGKAFARAYEQALQDIAEKDRAP